LYFAPVLRIPGLFRSACGARGWSNDDEDAEEEEEEHAIHKAKLTGDFTSPLLPSSEKGVQWEAAKAWADESVEANIERPSTMKGNNKVADVDALLKAIMP